MLVPLQAHGSLLTSTAAGAAFAVSRACSRGELHRDIIPHDGVAATPGSKKSALKLKEEEGGREQVAEGKVHGETGQKRDTFILHRSLGDLLRTSLSLL